MKIVYVAGPFSGPTRKQVEANIKNATKAGLEIAELGLMPLIPHANTSHPKFAQLQNYAFWIEGTQKLLEMCNAIYLIQGWESSTGARLEHEFAIEHDIERLYNYTDLETYAGEQSVDLIPND
jgi:hypothetical protein